MLVNFLEKSSDNQGMKLSKNKILLSVIFSLVFSFYCFADSTYVVKKGETLYSISKKYQLTVAELRAANNLSENDVLKEGAKLKIPSADIRNAAALSTSIDPNPQSVQNNSTVYYTIVAGDTLYRISKNYGINLAELLALNDLDNNSKIHPGQKIKVPGNAKKVDTPSSTNTKTVVTQPTNGQKADNSVLWPLKSPYVKNITGKVGGVQLTGIANEPVKCVREGTVMYTGVYRGFGEVIFVQSKTGLIYSYSGLKSVSAKKGDYVTCGTELGKVGKEGETTIKFMVFQNGKPIDASRAPRG